MASSIFLLEIIPAMNQHANNLQDMFNIREKFPLFHLNSGRANILSLELSGSSTRLCPVSETVENWVPGKK
jgi:hypothetical protein